MASTVAWLDTSADEQRRVREVIALFSQHESRDELGIGQVRDAMSDLLFPGTSVLQTRARYFLLVPWSFEHAGSRRGAGDLARRARDVERRLVEILVKGDDEGVIGKRAGAAVKNLPSALFWSGLQTYGILTRPVNPGQLTGAVLGHGANEAEDELVTRQVGEWHPTLPGPPPGFPSVLEGGLRMTPYEASWLRERMVESCRDTLLEHLLHADGPPTPCSAPWEDGVSRAAPPPARRALDVAHSFSLMINGAALLYNLLVAERYEAAGYSTVDAPVTAYRDSYDGWLEVVTNHGSLLRDWDAQEFWALVKQSNDRVPDRARDFVDTWIASVREGSVTTAAEDQEHHLRALVANREKSIKRTQSRLTNDKLLGAWSGASGAGRLTFRWSQVRQIVTDIHDGLERDDEAAHA